MAETQLTAGELLLRKKSKKVEKIMTEIDEEQAVEDWESLFPSPAEAKEMKNLAQQLTNAKLGKRKNESDLEYLMRVSYCKFCNIDMSLVNTTYIVGGKVARYVELKGILWAKRYPLKDYPERKVETLYSTPTECAVRGTIDGEHWVEVEYDIPKAQALVENASNPNNKHWKYNTQKMLVKSAKGDLFDLLSDTPMTENLIEEGEP